MFRNSRLRRDEIAAVIVHPLHNLATCQTRQEEEDSPNLRNECGYECCYAAWLHQLRAACDRYALPLLLGRVAHRAEYAAEGLHGVSFKLERSRPTGAPDGRTICAPCCHVESVLEVRALHQTLSKLYISHQPHSKLHYPT